MFDDVKGVEDVVSGYMGGQVINPSYEAICGGATGHAEVVQVAVDPSVVSYEEMLTIVFGIHDLTTLNRQGNDSGTQYRSVIFTHSQEQDRVARAAIAYLTTERIWVDAVVTEVVPVRTFYPAEECHQEFFRRNQHQGYCMAVVSPKVSKFRKSFAKLLKTWFLVRTRPGAGAVALLAYQVYLAVNRTTPSLPLAILSGKCIVRASTFSSS